MTKNFGWHIAMSGLIIACAGWLLPGCHHRSRVSFVDQPVCQTDYQQIEYPDVTDPQLASASQLTTAPPVTVRNFHDQDPWPMTLEEAIEYALANNQVLQKLGGIVVSAPQGAATVFDPAIQETNPLGGVESALSDFDAQLSSNLSISHTERKFNNVFAGLGNDTRTFKVGNYRTDLTKTTAVGTRFTLTTNLDYNRNPNFVQGRGERFASYWDMLLQAEVRQPLLQGAGTAVNRIAGPNAQPGSYNGVLIARIRGDVALADFEAAVRDLVRDVERSYWELYFAYRDLGVKIRAREAARLIWENRKKRVDAGLSRPDDEAQTRQQYYSFEQQVIDALSGNASGQTGVLGSERQLRRLLGLLNNDGRLIRPITDPTIAPIRFAWEDAQQQALHDRVELRRQKWIVRQRELELCAARQLNKWRLDAVGSYGVRGFGDNLFGSRDRQGDPDPLPVPGSAFDDLLSGDLDEWRFGFELEGPVGLRRRHLAVRNAELLLVRDKSLLEEQQTQLLLDLNAAYAEVDRSFELIKTNFNTRQAVLAELEPKRKRVEAGEEDVFFLLDAQQRASVSASAFHRAVVDYNLALQEFVYTSGGLLGHYNIRLAEGNWNQCAEIDARQQGGRFRYGPPNPNLMDVCPLDDGPVGETPDLMLDATLDPPISPDMPAPAGPPQDN